MAKETEAGTLIRYTVSVLLLVFGSTRRFEVSLLANRPSSMYLLRAQRDPRHARLRS